MKQIPFVEMPEGSIVDVCPPDGKYAVIAYNPGPIRRGGLAQNAFPWTARIYQFKGGVGRDISVGSNLGDMILRHEVAKVFLADVRSVNQIELRQMLAKCDIELVPGRTQEEALQILKSLRPVAGTDPDFDYEKGVPKS